ncbi:MAG: hypothetical protein CL920_00505 [Deltaproteobacteria bacterium]|nr:hypothetical protein [Deltaproteobacteria bacterium]|tara:strand:+ start:25150 stop:27117 length:1968 start_codon:yes stop_codon:yes gene_type:complete
MYADMWEEQLKQRDFGKWPILRYAMAKLVPGALVINFVINFIFGLVIFGGMDVIPFVGDKSVTNDTVVGAFFIGFFTMIFATPSGRAEALAGRIPGGGRGGLFKFVERHSFISSLIFAFLSSIFLGIGAIVFLTPLFKESGMSTWVFIFYKAIYSAVVGGGTAILVAYIGAQSAPKPHDDERWCPIEDTPEGVVTFPFDYVDKGGVAVTSQEHGCSGTPTWKLVGTGDLKPEQVEEALTYLLQRYPQITTVVQALDGHPEYAKDFRYAQMPGFSVDDIFTYIDARGEEERLTEIYTEVLNRFTDQFREPMVTMTLVQVTDDNWWLMCRQHHGMADGRAFIELLTDFATYLNTVRAGKEVDDALLTPIPKIPEADALQLSETQKKAYRREGYKWFVGAQLAKIFAPLSHFLQNDSNDYTGENRTMHWVLSDDVLTPWKGAQGKMNGSLNSILVGAVYEANRRWHKEMGRKLGRIAANLPMEMRPRDGSCRSFANHIGTLEVILPLHKMDSLAQMVPEIQRQVKEKRANEQVKKRLLCEHQLVSILPMDALRKIVFQSKKAMHNFSLSNLISLPFPTMEGPGWKVDEVLITTPITPRIGILITLIHYNGKIIFNVNYKTSAATKEQTLALFRHFQQVLEEATEHTPSALPTSAIETV